MVGAPAPLIWRVRPGVANAEVADVGERMRPNWPPYMLQILESEWRQFLKNFFRRQRRRDRENREFPELEYVLVPQPTVDAPFRRRWQPNFYQEPFRRRWIPDEELEVVD